MSGVSCIQGPRGSVPRSHGQSYTATAAIPESGLRRRLVLKGHHYGAESAIVGVRTGAERARDIAECRRVASITPSHFSAMLDEGGALRPLADRLKGRRVHCFSMR